MQNLKKAKLIKLLVFFSTVTIAASSSSIFLISCSNTVDKTGSQNDDISTEKSALKTTIENIDLVKKVDAPNMADAVSIVNASGFDIYNNVIFLVSYLIDLEMFNFHILASLGSVNSMNLILTVTSKKFPNEVKEQKRFTLSDEINENDKADELAKINTFISPILMSKTSNVFTAEQAVSLINTSGFNLLSNDIFTLSSVSGASDFTLTAASLKINEISINVTLTVTSKKYPSLSKDKDFMLTNFIEGAVDEANKIKAVIDKIVITKSSNTQTVVQAIALINTSGFDIYSNNVFSITPVTDIKLYDTSISAAGASDTEMNVNLTLTSKIYPSAKQTKTVKLIGFMSPISEGVSGTGVSKIYRDANVGIVYIGTANSYTMSGKTFYGDDFSQLNPFQDYGAEELELMAESPSWPQIKQLVASSRPVTGTPNMNTYLPAFGTPITFTEEIKNHKYIPNNVKRFISIIDEPKFNESFYYRNVVFTYRDFITAIAKYPRILAEVNLDASYVKNNADLKDKSGSLIPEKALAYIAKLEIANIFAHFMQETGGGYGNETIAADQIKRIPWNSHYDKDYIAPAPNYTNSEFLVKAQQLGITLANKDEMAANPSVKIAGPEKQALYYVSEAAYKDDTTEAARTAYTSWNLVSAPWTAASFPVPIGGDGKSTVSYIGRGAKQLSWNYNYGPASRVFFGDDNAETLLNAPERVAKEGWLAIGTAIMFYMTPDGNKPSMHDSITGAWEPTAKQQLDLKWSSGFGMSTNIINGGYESLGTGEDKQTPQTLNRQYYFSYAIRDLGIYNFATSSFFDNAGYNQISFDKATSVGKMSTDWTVSWDGGPVTLATWVTGTGFKVNFPGDYYRCSKSFDNSKFIEDNKLSLVSPADDAKICAIKAGDWKAGKNPTYSKVGSDYDWLNK